MRYRGRFAPSPTGPLHFGSLVAAVGSYARARAQGGDWLVRVEDIDPPREVAGAAADILATLAAFGMESDEPVVHQSGREPAYRRAFTRLRERDLVFPCWCSRQDLLATEGVHRGPCVASPDRERAPAWRLRMADVVVGFNDLLQGPQSQSLLHEVGDFVVRRVEGWFAYQLAVVVDDADAGITEIVRGCDLLDSTPRQIHLQRLLGLPTPAYVHLPLALDAQGAKLSKSDSARPIDKSDPIPALRAAFEFLGLDIDVRGTPHAMLRAAAGRFELAQLHAHSRRRRDTERKL
jgi:glutamyl-Q tRNA(Asp) synthetase